VLVELIFLFVCRIRAMSGPCAESCLQTHDLVQVKLLDEECILVDQEDRRIGSASKKICHMMSNINKGIMFCYIITIYNLDNESTDDLCLIYHSYFLFY